MDLALAAQPVDRLCEGDIELPDIRREERDADRRSVARAQKQAEHRLEIVDELIDRGMEAVVGLIKAQDLLGLAVFDQLDSAPGKDTAVAFQIGLPGRIADLARQD